MSWALLECLQAVAEAPWEQFSSWMPFYTAFSPKLSPKVNPRNRESINSFGKKCFCLQAALTEGRFQMRIWCERTSFLLPRPTNIASWGYLGDVLGRLKYVLACLGRCFAVFWAVLGCLGSILGRPRSMLGAPVGTNGSGGRIRSIARSRHVPAHTYEKLQP